MFSITGNIMNSSTILHRLDIGAMLHYLFIDIYYLKLYLHCFVLGIVRFFLKLQFTNDRPSFLIEFDGLVKH